MSVDFRKSIVKKMTTDDVDAVYEIEMQSFTSPWSKCSFVQEINQNKLARYWVIKLDDKVIGYGGCWLIVGEAHITNIAICTQYRNMGFGRRLVSGMIQDMINEDVNSVTLEVRKSNYIAQQMYKSMGFKIEGLRKNYYDSPNEDALILWKRI